MAVRSVDIKVDISFKVGDQVIHPQHGLGKISNLSIRQFIEDEKRLFYEVTFHGTVLWVPMNQSESGIRKVSVKSELISCRQLLKAPARPLNDDPRSRLSELSKHLKEGTITSHCEVVRDLTVHSWDNSLSVAIADFLFVTHNVLCQEWAAIEKISLEEAAAEINTLIKKNRMVEQEE